MSSARMVLVTLGLSVVAALPAHAATPYKVDVTWEGQGGMGRDYDQEITTGSCTLSDKASDSSRFHWKVVWKNVPLHLYLKGDRVTREKGRSLHPKATLAGSYTSTTHYVDGCDPNSSPQDCSTTVPFSGKGYPKDQTLLVARDKQAKYEFFVDAQTGVGGGDQCPNDTPFGTLTGGYYWTNFDSSDPPTPFNMGALSAFTFVPEHVLAGYGKIVDVIKSSDVKAPPLFANDCSGGVDGVTCAVSQQWHGTLTIQRAGRSTHHG